MQEQDYDAELDARGLFCPEPVMMLHNRIVEISPGAVLKVVATDPSTTRDIPRFCQFLDHELVDSGEDGKEFVFYIRRGS
ncbi:sulfurtransferase TusA [Marinobacter orientalis]|uniref:Sulfurtransferase TusA n=1 Tax=Marinobacter orientalis TaxID=1928859 RepID=A0A7Y0RCY9_9GAMM|nr:sulfurtransferase TusA [Marinobacter orientalis]NMT63959.1 sulfurtransferase TusA [Marinobacter orientalis]TGX50055.1 sulfurtransferase TusA [Marinobacter orientalis]